jgi:hypothetical protein
LRVNKVLPNKLRGSMESIIDKCWICSFVWLVDSLSTNESNYSLRTENSVNMFINKQTNNSQVVNVSTDRNVLVLNKGQIISLLQTRLLQTVVMNTICRQFCIAILLLQEHYCKSTTAKTLLHTTLLQKTLFQTTVWILHYH